MLGLHTSLWGAHGQLAPKSSLEHASALLLAHLIVIIHLVLIRDINFLVVTLLVDLHDVLLTLLHEHLSNIELVSQISTLLDLVSNVRILREYLLLEELLLQGVGTDLVNGHVDKLRLLVKANIVVANERVFLEFDAKVVLLLLREALRHQVIADTNLAFKDEVHIGNFIFLVQN